MSKDENLQDELKKIDNFFDNLTVEVLEKKLENSGILELQDKKAIEDLKEEIEILKENSKAIIDSEKILQYRETLLNLIEKQQKEIEDKDKRIFYLENEVRKEVNQELDKAKVDLYKNYVPKEAIRELLESEYNGMPMYRLDREYLPKNLKILIGE